MMPHLEKSQRWKYFVLNLHHFTASCQIFVGKKQSSSSTGEKGSSSPFGFWYFPSHGEYNSVLPQPLLPPSLGNGALQNKFNKLRSNTGAHSALLPLFLLPGKETPILGQPAATGGSNPQAQYQEARLVLTEHALQLALSLTTVLF